MHASGARVAFEATRERGGHFAAHEVPEVLVDDLRRMFGKKGSAYEVIKSKNGYAESGEQAQS